MNSVTINGITYKGSKSIRVENSTVYIDGKKVDHGETKNSILEIHVTGTLGHLEADGSVTCNDVHGDVQAGGSISCDNVGGTVQAGGSVSCDNVAGSVLAGGSVSYG